jgi:hypothetical protein
MDRVYRDNLVAVIISPGYGAGWYSWSGEEAMLFDPGLMGLIELGDQDKIRTYINLKWSDQYLGGCDELVIEWVPVGIKFRINEYDGAESIILETDETWFVA